jgi:hypothetical protein
MDALFKRATNTLGHGFSPEMQLCDVPWDQGQAVIAPPSSPQRHLPVSASSNTHTGAAKAARLHGGVARRLQLLIEYVHEGERFKPLVDKKL